MLYFAAYWVLSDLGIFSQDSGFHWPQVPLSLSMCCSEVSGLVWGLEARFPGFASHGDQLVFGVEIFVEFYKSIATMVTCLFFNTLTVF